MTPLGSPTTARLVGVEWYNPDTEGDSVIGYNARRLGVRDHPPAPGRFALIEVIR